MKYSDNNFYNVPGGIGADYLENFDGETGLNTSYNDGSFIIAGGLTLTYGHSRNEEDYAIDGNGIMLRRASDSYIEIIFTNGLSEFSFEYRKAFTGTSARQLEVLINGENIFTTPEFGTSSDTEETVYQASLSNLEYDGEVTLKIKNVGTTTANRQTTIDNIAWTESSQEALTTKLYSVELHNEDEIDVKTVRAGETLKNIVNPVKGGFNFLGWFDEDDNEFDFETQINQHMKLYAKFEEIPLATISEVRELEDGTDVVTRGVVTALIGNNAFIQDELESLILKHTLYYIGNEVNVMDKLIFMVLLSELHQFLKLQ